MRLKQVKLSGFKSFCDPTTFDLPGQLVGIVGPNGCGKSNVIDATRWVLGESRAAELRGESMQDVIFNGSSERKPASRASVELVFDNSLGRVGGAWSGFAEISVKRVLTRDGQSSYYINQQSVRRKDVHDIFLGTGLGPRAYAIIGQGTISRIIESKPDELRVFFEEAAGVSKYKERRRETENRLADTRENLTRVEDILRELGGQIEKLDAQAEIAGRFRAFEAERTEKQQSLWLIRRDDAEAERGRIEQQAAAVARELEALQTQLQTAETALVVLRDESADASDEVGRRQHAYYEVNSRIATLESQIRLITQSRSQIDERIGALSGQIESSQALAGSSRTELDEVLRRSTEASSRRDDAERAVASAREGLTGCQGGDAEARRALDETRRGAAEAQQALQVAAVRRKSHDDALAALASRRARTEQTLAQLDAAPLETLGQLADELAAARADELATGAEQEAAEGRARVIEASREPAQQRLRAALAKTTTIEARISVLSQLQARMHSEQKVKPWLGRHGIPEGVERIWQRITIEPGWELAVEAALRERVHALEVADPARLAAMLNDKPPGKVGLFLRDGIDAARPVPAAAAGPLTPLATMVRAGDPQLGRLLAEWLDGYFAAETTEQAFASRADLPPGGRYVVRDGHAIGRFDVSLFALDSDEDGVLARQQELQNLAREHRAQRLLTDEARSDAERVEANAATALDQVRQARDAHARAVKRVSAATIEHDRLEQAVKSRTEAHERLTAELAELAGEIGKRETARGEADAEHHAAETRLAGSGGALDQARAKAQAAEQALADARAQAQRAELALQEANFAVRSAEQEAANLRDRIARADEAVTQAAAERDRLGAERERLDDREPRTRLDALLGERVAAESALAAARNTADGLAAELRQLDEQRLQLERGQAPLRERQTELKLKEQAARLTVEQMAEALTQAECDIDALAARVAAAESRPKPSWLQSEVARLNQAVAGLGPVNLAALDELTAARERQGFLSTQSADLFEAMTTLENAIRTIDQETRALLQQTYDTVNDQFGRLFPLLFGGGEARLVLTGGEILDAGVQVFAQPPGKKNASIHLLSGGEKALTAIALVFAIFKLNPAPFCLLDEVDAPLDDANTERYSRMVRSMSGETQFVFITHNKIAMEMAEQLIGVTMQERGVSRLVAVDLTSAAEMAEAA
ncbi:MAG: chromosome segregation protein SMC [Lautropia sp.]